MSGRRDYQVKLRNHGDNDAPEETWQTLNFYNGASFRITGQLQHYFFIKKELEQGQAEDEILYENQGKPQVLKFASGADAEDFLREATSRFSKKRKAPSGGVEPARAAAETPSTGGQRRSGRDVDDFDNYSKHSSLPQQGAQLKVELRYRDESAHRGASASKTPRLDGPASDTPVGATAAPGWSATTPARGVTIGESPHRSCNFVGGGVKSQRATPRPSIVRSLARPQSSQSYSSFRDNAAFLREVVLKERGLRNLGNTCYLNAVAQSLSSLREFAATLKSMLQSVPAMGKGELFLRTTELLECTGSPVPTQGPFSPAQLRERIAKQAPMFGGCGQQDAHEFFLEWVNQLHDEMLAASEQWSREDPAQSDERAGFALATQQHFDSELRKRLVCETCGDHRDVHERFRDFSLDFDKSQSDSPLQLMLKSYFEQESLEAKCERCGCGRARMEKSLTSAPRVLVLHLKRFVPNPSLQRYEKQHGSVRIPSVLDLSQCVGCLGGGASAAASPAASPQRPPARPLAAEARSTPVAPLAPTAAGSVPGAETPPPRGGAGAGAGAAATPPPLARQGGASAVEHDAGPHGPGLAYDLRSVVAHEGASPHQGHYVSYARGEKGAWRLYDDAQVKDVGSDPAASLGRSAYILFYVLRGGAARA